MPSHFMPSPGAIPVNAVLSTKKKQKRFSLLTMAKEFLSDSSDDLSEHWHVSRMREGICKSKGIETSQNVICTDVLRACSIFLTGTVVLVTTVLIWFFIDVREQLTTLKIEFDQVIAVTEGVPDALQTCHTLDKNFKTNLTHITDEIKKLNRSLNTFSEQISNLQQDLLQVQVSLKSAPELTSVPNTVKALQNSIGELEINIHDLQMMYKILKNTTLSLQYSQDQQIQSLSKIENNLMELSNTSRLTHKVPTNETIIERNKLWNAIKELHKNLTHFNQTLTMNVIWAQEDLSNDHKKIVALQDMTQNASAQILTLQQECINREDQDILQNLLQSLSNRVDRLSNNKINQESSQLIEQKYTISPSYTDTSLSMHTKSETVIRKPNKYERKHEKLETSTILNYKTSIAHVGLPVTSAANIKQFYFNRNLTTISD